MKKAKNITNWLICMTLLFLLVGCGCSCSKVKYRSYDTVEKSLNEVFSQDETDSGIDARTKKFKELLKADALNLFDNYRTKYIDATKLSETDKTAIRLIRDNLETQINELSSESLNTYQEGIKTKFDSAILDLIGTNTVNKNPVTENDENISNDEYKKQLDERLQNATLLLFLVEKAQEEVTLMVSDKDYKDYQIILFNEARENANNALSEINTVIKESDLTEKSYDQVLLERSKKVYEIMQTLATEIQEHVSQPEPIRFQLKNFGQFFSNFFDNFLVYPIGLIILFFSKIFGGNYIVGLVIGTLIVRTIGWPIYAKTNDMSLKMKLMEPEQAKIQKKYERRKDPESQRMMQMEMARLYKKYKIGFGGCLLPFLQFPIFMAVFRAVSRFPYTNGLAGSANWTGQVKSVFLGIDLFKDRTAGTRQLIGIIILCVLVVGTQLLSQIISEKRMKKQQEKAQEDIPAYRRQAVAQGSQMQSSMKVMMYMMIAMMAVFVFTSEAALGVYWLIGNLYAIAQTGIGTKTSEKRLEKLREKHSK